MRAALWVLLLCGGCGLALPDGQIRCAGTEPSCPHGMSCAFDGRCWASGHHPVNDLLPGTACMFAESCASGSCADGVCCDSPCRDVCTSCASADQPGTCVAVADGELSPEGHDPCAQGEICRVGRCVRKAIAESCGVDLECESGACVDGVCCARQCGRCEICNGAGSVGSCTAAAAGTDPHGDCASATADALCTATCDGARNCLIPTGACKLDCGPTIAVHSPVGLPSTSDQQTFSCSAAGRCEFVSHINSCTTYQCGGPEDCKSSCTSGFDCNKGARCIAPGFCGPGLFLGVTCTTDMDCASQFCDPGSGKCRECLDNADCTYGTFCTAIGWCQNSTDCGQLDCPGDHFGSSCDPLSPTCHAAAATECTHPAAPNFAASSCVCDANQGPDLGCRHGDVCSSMTDAKNARCVGVAGRPCFADAACASGSCVAHVCAQAGPGVLCRAAQDCISAVCAPTAASVGRPVCN